MQLISLYQERFRRPAAYFALDTYSQELKIDIKAYLNLFVKVPVSVAVKNRNGALV